MCLFRIWISTLIIICSGYQWRRKARPEFKDTPQNIVERESKFWLTKFGSHGAFHASTDYSFLAQVPNVRFAESSPTIPERFVPIPFPIVNITTSGRSDRHMRWAWIFHCFWKFLRGWRCSWLSDLFVTVAVAQDQRRSKGGGRRGGPLRAPHSRSICLCHSSNSQPRKQDFFRKISRKRR